MSLTKGTLYKTGEISIEICMIEMKTSKYIDLYVTYTLILSSQGGVSDVIK